MIWIRRIGEESGVNPGMKRLHPSIQNFWAACNLRDIHDRKVCCAQCAGGAARRYQLDSHGVESAGKID
jgi:hypothetical protein